MEKLKVEDLLRKTKEKKQYTPTEIAKKVLKLGSDNDFREYLKNENDENSNDSIVFEPYVVSDCSNYVIKYSKEFNKVGCYEIKKEQGLSILKHVPSQSSVQDITFTIDRDKIVNDLTETDFLKRSIIKYNNETITGSTLNSEHSKFLYQYDNLQEFILTLEKEHLIKAHDLKEVDLRIVVLNQDLTETYLLSENLLEAINLVQSTKISEFELNKENK